MKLAPLEKVSPASLSARGRCVLTLVSVRCRRVKLCSQPSFVWIRRKSSAAMHTRRQSRLLGARSRSLSLSVQQQVN